MFQSFSDHLQGACMFLVKVTEFKSFYKFLKFWRLFVVMWQHNIWCVCVHAHTPNVMLPHHHINFLHS